ncbi:MAG: hypothetical protein PCFJNLEI_03181 [Verrucomicrobiae bacterium]|nr:hypothetical protein [Verrucomicrobiae bacterium]
MALVLALIGSGLTGVTPVGRVFTVVALILVALAYCFKTLTVQDERTHLAIRYGPVPVFSKRVSYAAMTDVKRARSTFLDGWGIHWSPGRGWTYNLWGFDCVEIRLGGKLIRIGTDDAEALAHFLQSKLPPSHAVGA